MGVFKRLLGLRGNCARGLKSKVVPCRDRQHGSSCFVFGGKAFMLVWSAWGEDRFRVASFPAEMWFELTPSERECIMSRFRQNVDQRKVAGTSKRAASDEAVEAVCPAILEFLTDREGPGGAVRQTSTVTLFAEDGLFKVCLNDRQEGLSTWASGETVQDTIESLEALLATGEAVWRRANGSKGKSRT